MYNRGQRSESHQSDCKIRYRALLGENDAQYGLTVVDMGQFTTTMAYDNLK